MRFTTTILAACLCVALVTSLPVPEEGFKSQALDRLMVVEADNESALRSKRTIGLLRQLFPDISKMIEDKVNMIVGEVFKIFGPIVFQSLLGGNKNGGGGGLFGGAGKNNDGSTVNVKSPFDDDDDGGLKSFVDDDDFFSKPKEENNGSKISFELPTIQNDEEPKVTTTSAKSDESTTTTMSSTESVTENTVE